MAQVTVPALTIASLTTEVMGLVSTAQRNGMSASDAVSVGIRPVLEELLSIRAEVERLTHERNARQETIEVLRSELDRLREVANKSYRLIGKAVLEADDDIRSKEYLHINQLAAISSILMANTPVTFAATKIEPDHALYTAAYQDAERAVEREIALRVEVERLKRKNNGLIDTVLAMLAEAGIDCSNLDLALEQSNGNR